MTQLVHKSGKYQIFWGNLEGYCACMIHYYYVIMNILIISGNSFSCSHNSSSSSCSILLPLLFYLFVG